LLESLRGRSELLHGCRKGLLERSCRRNELLDGSRQCPLNCSRDRGEPFDSTFDPTKNSRQRLDGRGCELGGKRCQKGKPNWIAKSVIDHLSRPLGKLTQVGSIGLAIGNFVQGSS
jgi:hypothetical protein